MTPQQKKSHKETPEIETDIITHIPEILKEKILSYLPLKEVVKTTILSKAWRNTWTTLSIIDINDDFEDYDSETAITTINSILSLHNGPINVFKLSFGEGWSKRDLEKWFEILSNNGIKDLYFSLVDRYKMPLSFFSCNTLNRVFLCDCSLILPLDFEGFMSLSVLQLQHVAVSKDDFEKLVKKCPKLEKLDVSELSSCVDLIIQGPNLKKMYISTVFNDIEIYAPNLVVVDHLYLHFPPKRNNNNNNNNNNIRDNCNFTRALGCMPQVEKMSLGNYFLMYAHPLGISDFYFPKLKELKLEVNFEDDKVAAIILTLLEKSPNLEILDIRMHFPEEVIHYQIMNFWEFLNLGHYLFEKLKLVTVNSFEFETIDITLSFFKMILACSPKLEKLHILGNLMYEESDAKMFLEQLPTLVKASIDARIVLEDEENDDFDVDDIIDEDICEEIINDIINGGISNDDIIYDLCDDL